MRTLDLPRRDVLGAVALSVAGTGCLADDEQDEPDDSDDEPASPDQASDDGSPNETDPSQSGDDSTASEGPRHVTAGPDGDVTFDPERLEVERARTVVWTWDSDSHNVSPTSIPDGADWNGHPEVANAGTTYEHAFDVPGRYEYQCDPHAGAGMLGEVVVTDADGEVPFDGTIVVGPAGELVFDPAHVEIEPGTTVRWEWGSDSHNVNPASVPEGTAWEGHEAIENEGFTYEHTFEVEGTYDYQCDPHGAAGMTGTIVVSEE